MLPPDVIRLVLRPLHACGVDYMITGSVAGSLYGEPRMTNDIDLVLALRGGDAARFCAQFPLEDVYCPPEDVLKIETGRVRRGHFNLILQATGFKVDCYLAGGDPLHAWAFTRRKWVETEGERVALAPPEYVILRKLEYYREGGSQKHLRDIAAVLNAQKNTMDRTALEAWIDTLGLQKEWAYVQGAHT